MDLIRINFQGVAARESLRIAEGLNVSLPQLGNQFSRLPGIIRIVIFNAGLLFMRQRFLLYFEGVGDKIPVSLKIFKPSNKIHKQDPMLIGQHIDLMYLSAFALEENVLIKVYFDHLGMSSVVRSSSDVFVF